MWSMWSVKEMWSKSRVFQSLGGNMWSMWLGKEMLSKSRVF